MYHSESDKIRRNAEFFEPPLPDLDAFALAIELYQQRAERLIAMRERKYYQEACPFLAKMRVLYQKLGENEAWASYVATLREQNRNLRALKDELAKAGL